MQIKSIKDADVAGKRVLVRCDLDVPIKNGKVVDDTRLRQAIPTLEFLHNAGAQKIVVIGHLGRPGGKVDENLRVAPVAARLKELGATYIEVKENLRFDGREEINDKAFAQELAKEGDLFVNEAFANSHRAHASMITLPTLLPSYAGLQLEEEITHLTPALTPPANSLAIIGGAKFETKVPLLTKLISIYRALLLGGALANDLLKARGSPVGSSLVSAKPVPPDIAESDKILIPVDAAMMNIETHMGRTSPVNDIRIQESFVDVGPQTASRWAEEVKKSDFVLWNGPLGVYEDGYTDATDTLAEALASSQANAVVGGGDTIAALSKFKFDPKRIFISTGGGAMLEFLTAGTLPAIDALKR